MNNPETTVGRWIPSSAIQPFPGMWEWESPDGFCCLQFNCDVVTEASIDLEVENYILKERKIKDENGDQLVYKTVKDYFLHKAKELGGWDSPLFQQEYLNCWDANTRKQAAFHQFDFSTHTQHYKTPMPHTPTEVFVDFGLHHPCAGIVQCDRYGDGGNETTFYHFHDVIRGETMSFDTFFDLLIDTMNREYHGCKVSYYPVQEGKIGSSQGFTSREGGFNPVDAMRRKGLQVIEAQYSKIAPRVHLTNEMLNTYHKGKPLFNFNPSNRDWIEMLEGGYRKEKITRFKTEVYTDSYFKDGRHDHLADGFTGWVNTRFGTYGTKGKTIKNYKGKVENHI